MARAKVATLGSIINVNDFFFLHKILSIVDHGQMTLHAL